MRKAVLVKIMVLGVIVALVGSPAMAFEPIPDESGFSGFVRLGAGYIRAESNMIAGNSIGDLGNKNINSLTSSPDSESDVVPQVDGHVRYTFASVKTQIHLGTRIEDLLRYDSTLELGVRKDFTRAGILGAGFVFTGMPAEVWEDPYMVNQNRHKTDRDSKGLRLAWQRILGSNFEMDYVYRKIQIDDEKSGEFQLIPGGFLTPSDADLLDREGNSHQFRGIYTWKFGERHVFTPAVWLLYEDLDGNAMKNVTIDFQPTYGYLGDKYELVVNAVLGYADYDDKNPIYGETNKDARYGIGLMGFWKNPFGWKPFGLEKFRFYGSTGYFKSDADINFYNTEIFQVSAGVKVGF